MTLVGDIVKQSVSIDFDFISFFNDVDLLQKNDRDWVAFGDFMNDFAFWSSESLYV